MIYLDDLAVWVQTQKGSILRGCLCGALVLGCLVTGFFTWNAMDAQAKEIEANKVTIAECKFQLDAINTKISTYDANADIEYFSPKTIGERIAALQSKYGGYNDGTSLDTIKKDAEAVRDEMSAYIEASASEAPWFNSVNTAYEWTYPMREESIVERVPVIFECRDRRTGELYGVVAGLYDGSTERCGSFDVYHSLTGHYKLVGESDGYDDSSTQTEGEVGEIIEGVSGQEPPGGGDVVIIDGTSNPELEGDGSENPESGVSGGDTEPAGEAVTGGTKVTKKLANDEILSSVLREEGLKGGSN